MRRKTSREIFENQIGEKFLGQLRETKCNLTHPNKTKTIGFDTIKINLVIYQYHLHFIYIFSKSRWCVCIVSVPNRNLFCGTVSQDIQLAIMIYDIMALHVCLVVHCIDEEL